MKSKIMNYNFFVLIFLFACNPGVETETEREENWLKGNLHTHSLWSDGDDFPEMIMDWYKSNGYDFVSLTDHNILQKGDKWVNTVISPTRKKAFAKYLDKYGEDWVNYSGDSAKLKTLEEYKSRFESDSSFLILSAEEITSGFEGKPIHVNATNLKNLIPGQTGNSVSEVMQNAIDAVNNQRKETGQPMFPHINHPNFGWGITAEDFMKVSGERFFEVYNGHPSVNNYGDETHESTESMWDRINTRYIADDKPLLYGVGTDDSHNYHLYGARFSNVGRGWVMVNSDELTPDAIIAAMEKGDFYASSGIVVKSIVQNDHRFSFNIEGEEGVEYTTRFVGVMKGKGEAEVLKQTNNLSPFYELTGDEIFVRASIVSSKLKIDPFEIGENEKAWLQPYTPQKK